MDEELSLLYMNPSMFEPLFDCGPLVSFQGHAQWYCASRVGGRTWRCLWGCKGWIGGKLVTTNYWYLQCRGTPVCVCGSSKINLIERRSMVAKFLNPNNPSWQRRPFALLNDGRKVWTAVLFFSAIMHRRVVHVFFSAIFAVTRLVEIQKFCHHGNVM